ncbi:MAG: FHA domain-containing protein [Synechococcaceae cyanobacterium RL_1_2]|nr:FHA domain-containing protein [Synechococcaceae cyanobacterium RL_1_2]
MITITLLHPIQSVPVQNWNFGPNSVIRIGRATDNEVVLYSAVVSRHHVLINQDDEGHWYVNNTGSNGTYIDGQKIEQPFHVQEDIIIRLASSGPKIQIRLDTSELMSQEDKGKKARVSNMHRKGDRSKDTLIGDD